MKDTKGVRQVLHDYYNEIFEDCLESIERDGLAIALANAFKKQEKFDRKAEAKLQEIMLGMLPEEDTRMFPGMGGAVDHSEIRETCYQQGWNSALTKVKQNIRGGFKV